MGSISFNQFANVQKAGGHYYSDIHFDIKNMIIKNSDGSRDRDIQLDYDDISIANSLSNIMLTHPGENFLAPNFGTNLYAYLFEAVSEQNAKQIGVTIKRSIEDWEPRVTVNRIVVYALNDIQEYLIELSIGVPLLSKNFDFVQKLKRLDQYNL